jgi:glycosyltransferase involved in cell wall biosynthesis
MVPTEGMLKILEGHRFANLRPWSHGVDLSLFRPVPGADLGLPRPVFLAIGRVSYEKNLEAFLAADLPGTKVVYGQGPLLERLRARHPEVVWRGVVPRAELAAIYSAADAFVFPSRADTFGLVMLEALACGTPVAAYPVAGPLTIGPGAGVLHDDLHRGPARADIPREQAQRARAFDWATATRQFLHTVPVNGSATVTTAS